jgi:ABC-type transport system involved in multi-copper enzyme maturation permease subunit
MLGTEVRRLLSHPAPIVALAIPAIVAALSVFGTWGQAKGHIEAVKDRGVASTSSVTAFESVAEAFRDSLWIAALLLAGLASQSLSGDLSRGTLRNLFLTPIGRIGVTLGKALGILAAAVGCYLLLSVVAVGASSAAFDFGDVVEILETDNAQPWVLQTADKIWPYFIQMLPAMLLTLAAYAALGFLAGAVAKRGVTGLALAAGSVIFLEILRIPGRSFGFEPKLLSAHLPTPLGDSSQVGHLLNVIRAPNEPIVVGLTQSLATPTIWLVVSIALATLIVSRRSVP